MIRRFFYLLWLSLPLLVAGGCKQNTSNSSREHFLKANDLVFNGDFDNGRKEYDLAIKADTGNWQAYYQLANVCELQGDIRGAAGYFSRAIALKPKFAL